MYCTGAGVQVDVCEAYTRKRFGLRGVDKRTQEKRLPIVMHRWHIFAVHIVQRISLEAHVNHMQAAVEEAGKERMPGQPITWQHLPYEQG